MVDGFLALGAAFFLSPHHLRKRFNSKDPGQHPYLERWHSAESAHSEAVGAQAQRSNRGRRLPWGGGMAGGMGGWGLRVREQLACRRILSAYSTARYARGTPRGTEHRGDSLRWAKKVLPLSNPRAACRYRSSYRRG